MAQAQAVDISLRDLITAAVNAALLQSGLQRPEPDQDALLTDEQAAELLNLSPRTLGHWRARKYGPHWVKCSKAVRYRRGDLTDWIKKNSSGFASSSAAVSADGGVR